MGAIAKDGDPTTTQGRVSSFHDSGKNHGISIARHGDKASCGNCPGLWPIVASCEFMRFDGNAAVQDGDLIACPCGKNRVIAASRNMHYGRSTGGTSHAASGDTDASNANTAEQKPSTQPSGHVKDQPPIQRHIQRIRVWDSSTGEPLAYQPYIAEVQGSAQELGRTDGSGMATIETDMPKTFRLHVVFATPKRHLKPSQGT